MSSKNAFYDYLFLISSSFMDYNPIDKITSWNSLFEQKITIDHFIISSCVCMKYDLRENDDIKKIDFNDAKYVEIDSYIKNNYDNYQDFVAAFKQCAFIYLKITNSNYDFFDLLNKIYSDFDKKVLNEIEFYCLIGFFISEYVCKLFDNIFSSLGLDNPINNFMNLSETFFKKNIKDKSFTIKMINNELSRSNIEYTFFIKNEKINVVKMKLKKIFAICLFLFLYSIFDYDNLSRFYKFLNEQNQIEKMNSAELIKFLDNNFNSNSNSWKIINKLFNYMSFKLWITNFNMFENKQNFSINKINQMVREVMFYKKKFNYIKFINHLHKSNNGYYSDTNKINEKNSDMSDILDYCWANDIDEYDELFFGNCIIKDKINLIKDVFNERKKFKNNLINTSKKLFGKAKCWANGCDIDVIEMLVGSHIKSVSEILSSNTSDNFKSFEIIDENNGLLLCKNHDSLFDKHLISITDKNNLLFNDKLKKYINDGSIIGLRLSNTIYDILLNEKRKFYLSNHRKNFDLKKSNEKK